MRECVWRGAHDRDMRLIDVRVCVCMYMPLLTKYSKWFTCISCVCVCIIPVFASQCVNTVLCAFYLSQRLSAFALAPLSLANLNCATDRMR